MSLEIEATYENGVLKLDRPLPLQEQERVRVTIHPKVSHAQRLYGIMGLNLDPELIRQVALDPEFGIHEAP